jgi:transcriptional regulator with XRE-family HTH domain
MRRYLRQVALGVTMQNPQKPRMGAMSTATYGKTYIKAWREKRGLSLRQLAARMERTPGEELISFASLARIEKGQQPYSQPILEALAAALDVSVSSLLEVNPDADGEVIDLMRRLKGPDRDKAIAILKTMLG